MINKSNILFTTYSCKLREDPYLIIYTIIDNKSDNPLIVLNTFATRLYTFKLERHHRDDLLLLSVYYKNIVNHFF